MSQVTVLGSVKSRSDGSQWETLAPSARQLLAILVAAGPPGLSFERAADELWPADLPATWDSSLRMALTRLRRRLPPDSLTSKSGWCRLELESSQVDAWHLAELGMSTVTPFDANATVGLLAQEAYPNVEISPIIRSAIDEFDILRSVLLDRLIEQTTSTSPLVATRLRAFSAARDWDTELAMQADRLASTSAHIAPPPWAAASMATMLPPSLDRQRAKPLFGHDEAVDQLVALATDHGYPVSALAAVPKNGCSATLAEVGARLVKLGWRVIHIEPTAPAAAFGPFIQALPHLRGPLLAALESDASPAKIRSRCWMSILQALDAPDSRTCVIVDDVEFLDSNSEAALGFVRRSNTANQLSILGALDPAHPAIAGSFWLDVPVVEMAAIRQHHVQSMIAEVHPHSTDLQRVQLSSDVMELAGGLAGRAFQLVEAADARTLTLPSFISSGSDSATIDLSDETLRVAVAASVVAAPISLEDLEHVAQDPAHLILTAVDALLGLGVFVETSRPDVFELVAAHRHTNVQASIQPHELARFHRRAMSLPSRDPVALAAHALQAQALVSDTDAIAAQLEAAETLVDSRSYREAVAHFQAAEALGAVMSARQLIAYAASLEFIGAAALEVRQQAMTVALNNGERGLALEAVLAGLPSAEQFEGDAVRMQLIDSIDPAGLTKVEQLRRHLGLSRQLLLLSRAEDAHREARAAGNLAETVDEEADAWLAATHVDRWMPRGDRTSGFETLRFRAPNDVTSPERRARLHQAAAISALIAGDFVAAASEIDRLSLAAEMSGAPLRVWHAALLRTTELTNELRFNEADRAADEARDIGVPFGLAGAVATRLAQESNQSMILGRGRIELKLLDGAPDNVRTSLLVQAGIGLQLALAGRMEEATKIAERVLHTSAGSPFELAVAGVLSSGMRRTSPAMAATISNALDPHRGQLLILGAGVSAHGPIESLLANVAASDAAALSLRREAVELADSWESPLWQITTRVSLGNECRHLGREAEARTFLSEAAERAAGTEFSVRERLGLFEH